MRDETDEFGVPWPGLNGGEPIALATDRNGSLVRTGTHQLAVASPPGFAEL